MKRFLPLLLSLALLILPAAAAEPPNGELSAAVYNYEDWQWSASASTAGAWQGRCPVSSWAGALWPPCACWRRGWAPRWSGSPTAARF